MRTQLRMFFIVATIIAAAPLNSASAESLSAPVALIEKYEGMYLAKPLEEQADEIRELLKEAEDYRDLHPGESEAWTACALIRFGYGVSLGMMRLGRMLKTVRSEFETAIELDESALGGFATAFLGRVYYQVPRWPISFGDRTKGGEMVRAALDIDGESRANLLYYGWYLRRVEDNWSEAEKYFLLAKETEPMENLPNWDASLFRDIERNLELNERRQ